MLDELLKDHRTGQDSTQLGNFVLGGRTKWGTYKQAIRELYKRIRGLRQMITDRDLLYIDMEDLQDRIEGDDTRDAQRAKIELRALHGRLEESERGIRDTKREAVLFYRVAKELKDEFGEIDEMTRIKLDREDWRWWHLKRAAISKLVTGRLDNVILKNMCSLPIEERNYLLNIMKDDQTLERLIEQSEYGRELPSEISEDEIKLIEQNININKE